MLFQKNKFSNEKTTEERLAAVIQEVAEIKKTMDLKLESNPEKKDEFKFLIDQITPESLWSSFYYNTDWFPFTLNVAVNGSTSATVQRYQESSGLVFNVERPTKMRTSFYFGGAGPNNFTAYVVSFHTRKEIALSNTNPMVSNGAQFAGLKIVNGNVFLVSTGINSSGQSAEKLVEINRKVGNLESLFLEMEFYPNERVDYYLDGKFVGTITGKVPSRDLDIYYPLWASGVRSDSLSHSIVIEFFEFLQSR